jgi:hypothetical protein
MIERGVRTVEATGRGREIGRVARGSLSLIDIRGVTDRGRSLVACRWYRDKIRPVWLACLVVYLGRMSEAGGAIRVRVL